LPQPSIRRLDPSAPADRRETIALVASMIALNALAIDIMLPGMQVIGESLGEPSANARQFVVTAYLLGFGAMQLIFGPLSDRFGRRRPLLIGLSLYTVAALCGGLAPSFPALLGFRLLQGCGAAASVVIAMAFVRDSFGGRRMAEVMSLVMMVFLVTPVVAPALGQAILAAGEWRLVFAFMVIAGLSVSAWATLRLPETLRPENRRPLTPASVLQGFGYVFRSRVSICYILAMSMILGALFGFINSAQQIYVGIFGLGVLFPAAFAAVAGCMALGSYLNARWVGRLGMRRISHSALLGFMTASAVLAASSAAGALPLALFLPLFAAAMFCFSCIGSNFGALALEPLGHVAGTAASVQGSMQIVVGAAIGAMIGQAFNGTVLPLALGFTTLAAAAMGLVLLAERGRLFGSRDATAARV
jgi:DHA1 family bicyclomycin/chloramphenicol resistance-like MFS transporter